MKLYIVLICILISHGHCQQTLGKRADSCGNVQYDILEKLEHISQDIQKHFDSERQTNTEKGI